MHPLYPYLDPFVIIRSARFLPTLSEEVFYKAQEMLNR